MTRTGPATPVDPALARGRLDNARAFFTAASNAVALADPHDNANPILTQIVSAAIAYTDALTARYSGVINRQDHAAARKALRAALGNRLPKAQDRQLARILERKDEAQYGFRHGSLTEAARLLRELENFASWAESEFAKP
ncbi:MAG: hypothetical protein ACREH6_00670 [Geminicoccaceae bacterium]